MDNFSVSTFQHIFPLNDYIEHNTDGLNCVCEPKIDWNDMLVIHNSADGREFREEKIKEIKV